MVTLDASQYRHLINDIRYFTEEKDWEWRIKYMGLVSDATKIEIILIAYYIGELYGFSPELIKSIYSFKNFYRVNEVIGLTSGKDPYIV